VVFDLDAQPRVTLFDLSSPDRLVIDFSDAAATMPASPDFADTPVQRLRSARRNIEDLRVVLDLAQSLPRYRYFTLPPEAGRGHRLVVDLYGEMSTDLESEADLPVVMSSSDADARIDGTGSEAITASGAQDELAAEGGDAQSAAENADTSPVAERAVAGASAAPASGVETSVSDTPPPQHSRNTLAAKPRPSESTSLVTVDFSGTWEQEWAWATDRGESQKFDALIEPRVDVSFGNGISMTAIGRLRYDTVGDLGPGDRKPWNYSDISAPWYNSDEARLSLRELYMDIRAGFSDWRLGKQQVVWGQADGIKVLDVVNPQSFREFILDDFEDSRIPLWMANVTTRVGNANLQLLWIPDTTYHELADFDAPFAPRSPRLLPPLSIAAIAEPDKPDDFFSDGDFGAALSGFSGGWDWSINYLYRYLDQPALPVVPLSPGMLSPGMPPGAVLLAPEYKRSHLLGGSFSTALGSMTLRGELAWNSDTYQPLATLENRAVGETPEVSGVIGLDWTPSMETLVSAQFFNTWLPDHDNRMQRDANEQLVTLLYQQDFANATWRFRGIGLHSINDGDSLLQLKLSYWFSSSLQLWIGADLFDGKQRGLFGQYDEEDRVLMGLELGF
ncbi:MAG: AMIN domain-containing protein, partial [Chromatocurvus sp.]